MSYTPADTLNDQEVRRELLEVSRELEELRTMRVIYVEPSRPREGNFCICDGTNWNPLGDGIKRPVWYDAEAGTWKAF